MLIYFYKTHFVRPSETQKIDVLLKVVKDIYIITLNRCYNKSEEINHNK